jgi:hypothetical protein
VNELTCAKCGEPIFSTAGYWNLPTPAGLVSVCAGCKDAPKLPPLPQEIIEREKGHKQPR